MPRNVAVALVVSFLGGFATTIALTLLTGSMPFGAIAGFAWNLSWVAITIWYYSSRETFPRHPAIALTGPLGILGTLAGLLTLAVFY